MLESRKKPLVLILQVVADHYKIDADVLVAKAVPGYRPRYLDRPRRTAMLLIRETGVSFPDIGRFFNRDHSTVLHGVRLAEEEIAADTLQLLRDKITAAVETKPGEGCPRCRQLQLDLILLKAELMELRLRMGCG